MEEYSRRNFLKSVVAAGVALTATDGLASVASELGKVKNPFDAKGLPTTILGHTGVRIPRIVLGLGSRFCHIDEDEDAYAMLNYALDNGFYYWDTAHAYDNTIALPPWKTTKPKRYVSSEVRVGEVIQYRRKEVFLSTKVTAREPSEAMKEIELSLKQLKTDRLDMLKIHDVQSIEDVNQMSQKGHLIDILHKMKEEKVTRFIGFSGHGNPEALKELASRAKFDSMLIAMNHWNAEQNFHRQEEVLPEGKKKRMGVLVMKAVRPKETIPGMQAPDLVRYAMSLENIDAVVIGMDSIDVVNSNLEILRNFKKMAPEKMKEMALQLAPFYRHENLPWMQQGYIDGHWG